MPTLDTSLLADIQPPDLVGAQAKAYQLKDLMDTNQLNQYQLNQARVQQAKQKQIQDLLSKSDLSTFKGQQAAGAALTKIDPEYGMQFLSNSQRITQGNQGLSLGQLDQQLKQWQVLGAKLDARANVVMPVAEQIARLKAQGASDTFIEGAIQPQVVQAFNALKNTQGPDGKSLLGPEDMQAIQQNGGKITPQMVLTLAQRTQQGRAAIAQALKNAEDQANKKQQLGIEQGTLTEKQQHDREIETIARGKGLSTPPELDPGTVAEVASGASRSQVVAGFGQEATAQWNAYRKAAIQSIKADHPGMTDAEAGRELANRTLDYKAENSSLMQLNKMKGATEQAVSQLEFNIDKVTSVLKNIPSSNISPVINAIARGEEKWTGDPRYAQLFFYMNAVANESARILSGGQASSAQLHEGARLEAQQWASVNMTPQSFVEGVAPALLREGRARIQTYEDALSEQRNPQGGPKAYQDLEVLMKKYGQ